ncbi:MAG: hypothetical protein ABW133_10150 [Polyangiaceae bacterium]
MRARTTHKARALFLASAIGLGVFPSGARAEPAIASESSAPTTQVAVIDVGTLPKGDLPSAPTEKDAPTGVPAFTQPTEIAVEPAGEITRPRRPRKKSIFTSVKKPQAKRSEKVKLVSIAAASPTIDAFYAPSADATEFDGSSSQKMSCTDQSSIAPMRWESLATTPEGDARLETHDLWFDSKTCAVGPGPMASATLKAVAWEKGKPWLFAMQSPSGVTLVMPKVSEISSESMVGAPVTMRGDFTRITLPIGRWGSGSIVAQVESLGAAHESDSSGPVEVGIEIVQTMSEKAPTLLVRTRRAPPEPEARD